MIVPKIEYAGEIWEGNNELADKLENSADVNGKEDTRMFENNQQYSIESRVGNVRSQTINRDTRNPR